MAKGVIPPQLRQYAFTSATAAWFQTAQHGYDPFSGWQQLIANAKSAGLFSTAAIPEGSKLGGHLVVHVDPQDYKEMINTVDAFSGLGRSQEVKDALQKVGEYIVKNVIPRMFEEEANYQGMWPELAENTYRWRGAITGWTGQTYNPILRFQKDLFDATRDPHRMIEEVVGGDNARVVIGGKKLQWKEANKFYTHMLGGTSPWYKGGNTEKRGKIAPRPFIPQDPQDFSTADNMIISEIFRTQIEMAVERRKHER
jgi:hypothetical protein